MGFFGSLPLPQNDGLRSQGHAAFSHSPPPAISAILRGMTSSPVGIDIIRRTHAELSTGPGVYRMLGAEGNVLYVGKARNLKNRVANYTNPTGLSPRIARMVAQVAAMEIITTGSEAEALLLEANLIKTLRPKYNILLRDDKSYPYLLIAGDHAFPQIRKHRGAQNKKGKYFGPFASVHALNETLAILQKAFLLRPCADTVFKNRTRPCLQYQIKRCSAPCVGYVSEREYAGLVTQAMDFLSGKNRELQEALSVQMQRLSDAMDYEGAAILRDRIKALTQVQQEQGMHPAGVEFADVIALARQGGDACMQVFFFRGGQNFGNRSFFLDDVGEVTDSDVMQQFLGQFYQSHPVPREIILSHAPTDTTVMQAALEKLAGRSVALIVPQRGDKTVLVEAAKNNAVHALQQHVATSAANADMLVEFAETFHLPAPPKRIEVYDNSHISGTNAIGAFIVAGPEGFNKKAYRTFTMRGADYTAGDDFAMMREMLTRRFTRLQTEDAARTDWPDVILIDGGKGQLSATLSVMEDLGVTGIACIAISKGPDRNAGREEFHLLKNSLPPCGGRLGRDDVGSETDYSPPPPLPSPARGEGEILSFRLPPGTPLLHYLQRLRDEAHRFAIGTHRGKRSRAAITSELDAIPSIGPTRKKALLHHFGSAKAVSRATLAELENVIGIDRVTAKKIFEFFQ